MAHVSSRAGRAEGVPGHQLLREGPPSTLPRPEAPPQYHRMGGLTGVWGGDTDTRAEPSLGSVPLAWPLCGRLLNTAPGCLQVLSSSWDKDRGVSELLRLGAQSLGHPCPGRRLNRGLLWGLTGTEPQHPDSPRPMLDFIHVLPSLGGDGGQRVGGRCGPAEGAPCASPGRQVGPGEPNLAVAPLPEIGAALAAVGRR